MASINISKLVRPNLFTLAAVNIGGALEWYEIGLFISWPIIIEGKANLFKQSLADSLNLTGILAMIALSLASGGSRGIGAWLFGILGDKTGRKGAFSLSVLLATLPSLILPLLALSVPYELWIGYSPIIFAIVKVFQGIPAGGEFPGAICYLAETGNHCTNQPSWIGRRYMCSYTVLGPQIGLMLSMIVCLILKSMFSTEILVRNGWQIVFLISGLMGLVGYVMRHKLHETHSFLDIKSHHKITANPLKTLFSEHLSNVTFGFIVSIFETVLFIVISLMPLFVIDKT